MGRYIANGIPIWLGVYSKGEYTEEEFKEVKEELGRFINLDHYTIDEIDESKIIFLMKPEVFNNNIHQTIRDIDELTKCADHIISDLFFSKRNSIDIYNDEFCKENYPIKLEVRKKEPYEHYEGIHYCAKSEDGLIGTDSYFFEEQYWLFNDRKLKEKFRLGFQYITLYYEIDKFFSEDETSLLRILNNMKIAYYKSKNELTQDIIYFILG